MNSRSPNPDNKIIANIQFTDKQFCFGNWLLSIRIFLVIDVWLAVIIFSLPSLSFAGREAEIDKVLQKTKAKQLAYEYIKDLRTKITEEKYETIPLVWEKFSLRQSGSIRNEFAYRISQPREFTKIKEQLFLSETGKFSDALRFKLSGRFYYDAVFNLTHSYGENAKSDQRMEAELRETYLDYSYGPWDMRLGKQQIVWGEAVALFFADAVNAKDLREFILPDFDLIRIPQWGIDAEYSKEKFHAEFVWLPILEFDKLGVTGSEFRFHHPIPSATTLFTTKDPEEPNNSFKNSDVGLRLSYLLNGWDVSGFYFYSWTRSPVYYRTISDGVFNFSPTYKRLNMIGATFAKELKEFILKGEFVFNKNDYFSTFNNADEDGIVRRNVLNYLLGLDYTFFDKVDTSLQFMQRIIFDFPDLLANEEQARNSFALWIKTGLFNDKLEPECTIVTSLMEEDVMYRPRINLKLKDNWKIRFGVDIFQGRAAGIFGKFDKKSRLYCETIYKF